LERAKNAVDAAIALRFGYAFDRLLVFGKLGADWGRLKWTREEPALGLGGCCTITTAGQRTVPGLLIGAGFEYAFLDNWTAKMEYDFISFGNPTVDFAFTCRGDPGNCAAINFVPFRQTVRDTEQIVKIGINYKFQ
jgi:outer membrane immunogenic protein